MKNQKTIAMYFPLTLEDALWSEKCKLIPSNILINDGENMIQFAHNFKYLGALISDTLKEELEIKTRIMKAWSVLGAMKHLFKEKDIDFRAKALLYISGPINALLWGAASWNLTKHNLKKLTAFTTQP